MANDFDFTESGYTPSLPYDFYFGEMVSYYYVLKGASNNFSSIWVMSGKLYAASSEALTAIDMSNNSLYDWYDQTHVGRAQESLDNSGIIDINVVG
jgi:hypothetical protein